MSDKPRALKIDWVACSGYGACAVAAPDLFDLDDWGYPIFDQLGPVPDELLRQAHHAVSDCPMVAVSLQTVQRGHGRR